MELCGDMHAHKSVNRKSKIAASLHKEVCCGLQWKWRAITSYLIKQTRHNRCNSQWNCVGICMHIKVQTGRVRLLQAYIRKFVVDYSGNGEQ